MRLCWGPGWRTRFVRWSGRGGLIDGGWSEVKLRQSCHPAKQSCHTARQSCHRATGQSLAGQSLLPIIRRESMWCQQKGQRWNSPSFPKNIALFFLKELRIFFVFCQCEMAETHWSTWPKPKDSKPWEVSWYKKGQYQHRAVYLQFGSLVIEIGNLIKNLNSGHGEVSWSIWQLQQEEKEETQLPSWRHVRRHTSLSDSENHTNEDRKMYCSAVLLEISVLKITFLFCFCTLSAYLLTFLVLLQQFYTLYHIISRQTSEMQKNLTL